MEVKHPLVQKLSAGAVWCIGNILWGFITRIATQISKESPMIEGIGYLVLIVLGICGAWWYLWGRSRRPNDIDIMLDNMGRHIMSIYFAQQYNVNAKDLVDLNHPQAMEEKAKRLQSERELAKLKSPTQ